MNHRFVDEAVFKKLTLAKPVVDLLLRFIRRSGRMNQIPDGAAVNIRNLVGIGRVVAPDRAHVGRAAASYHP